MSIAEILDTMEYGPAPESDTDARGWIAKHAEASLFIDGAWTRPLSGEWHETDNPATGEVLARIAVGGPEDVEAALKAARKAQGPWSRRPGHQRAKYLYAIARLIQRHSRLFAVIEALDNGKPIRETRDIDVPLVARHFYHHAGWAELMASELPDRMAVGVCGQIIPWNFPLLMLAWKIAPAIALRQHGHPEAGRVHAAVGAAVRRDLRDGRAAQGRRQHCHRPWLHHRRADRQPSRHRQDRFHRLDRNRPAHPRGDRRHRQVADAGARRQVAVYRLRRRRSRLGRRRRGRRDLVQSGPGVLRRVAPPHSGRRLRRHGRQAQTRLDSLRVGSPLDKAIDLGAIVAPVQLQRITKLVEQGVAEGATLYQTHATLPATGCFYPPTLLANVEPASTVARVEIFGPVAVAMSFRTPDEAVALANNTEYGLAASIWSESINLALDVAPKVKAGRGLGEFHQPLRRSRRFRRLQGIRLRPRGRPRGRARLHQAALDEVGEETERDSAPEARPRARTGRRRHRPHGKALHRRQAEAPRRRLFASRRRAGRQAGRRGRRGQPQGYPRCGRGRPQGASQVGDDH